MANSMFPFKRKTPKPYSISGFRMASLKVTLNQMDRSIRNFSNHMHEVASAMRGRKRPPAIFLHGVMPRSGTVYFGEVRRLHPDIFAYPNKMWEMPFLVHAGDLISYQEKFFQTYEQNRSRMEQNDLLCIFGSGIMEYLHSFVPEKNLLIKVPWLHYLHYFHIFFPFEKLILLMLGGRDLVQSTVKTWPGRNLTDV